MYLEFALLIGSESCVRELHAQIRAQVAHNLEAGINAQHRKAEQSYTRKNQQRDAGGVGQDWGGYDLRYLDQQREPRVFNMHLALVGRRLGSETPYIGCVFWQVTCIFTI